MATSGVPIYKVIAPEGKCKHENTTCNPEVSQRLSLSLSLTYFNIELYYISPSSCKNHFEIETLMGITVEKERGGPVLAVEH